MNYKELSKEDRIFEIIDDTGKKATFIYDPDRMSVSQITDARTKLQMYDKMIEVLPSTPNDLQEAMKKEVLKKGLAALLLPINVETDKVLINIYNSNTHPGLQAMDKLKGIKDYHRLEACKTNFFISLGIVSVELIQPLVPIMQELKKEGLTQEQINLILKAAISGDMNELKISVEKSTPKNISKTKIKKK